jgi:uncharacterized protein YdhG (YjbR/CyaY superfamily)
VPIVLPDVEDRFFMRFMTDNHTPLTLQSILQECVRLAIEEADTCVSLNRTVFERNEAFRIGRGMVRARRPSDTMALES